MLGAIIEEWGAGAAGSGRGCHLALRWLDALFVECVAAVKGNKGLGLEGPTVSAGGSGLGLGEDEDEGAGCGPGGEGKGKVGIALWGGAPGGEDGDGEDGEGVDAGLGGTVYEDVLLALLERLREAGLLSEMRELLLQVRIWVRGAYGQARREDGSWYQCKG